MGPRWKRWTVAALAGGVVILTAAPALATLPFVHSADTSGANGDGPRFCSNNASVFYRFTPAADVRVQVDTLGSDFDTVLAIYTRESAGAVRRVGCSDDRFGVASGLRFRAHEGVTYLWWARAAATAEAEAGR